MIPSLTTVDDVKQTTTTPQTPEEKFYNKLNSLYGEHTEELLTALRERYVFTPKSIHAISETKNGQKLILVTYTPVFITERFKDKEGALYVQLEAFTGQEWLKFPIEPIENIANTSKITSLVSNGLDVSSVNQRALIGYLSYLRHLVQDILPVKTLLKDVGWHNGHFYLPNVFDENARFLDTDSSSAKALTCAAGDIGDWCKAYETIINECNEARFIMACAFAAPLVERLHYNGNPLIYLYGKNGSGKSALLHMAASIWGNSKLICAFDGTSNGFEMRAAEAGNLPCLMDDVQVMRKMKNYHRFMERLIYQFYNGKGKLRANKDIKLRNVLNWHTLMILNGETPIITSDYYGGARRRFIEVKLPAAFSREHLSYYYNTSKKNYGWAGPIYLQMVELMQTEHLQKLFEQLRDFLYKYDDGKHENTIISILALVGVAEALAHASLFHAEDPFKALEGRLKESAAMVMQMLRSLEASDEKADASSYYETIMSTIDMNLAYFDILNAEKKSFQLAQANTSYGFFYKGNVYINTEAFKSIFMQHFSLDSTTILQALREHQFLKTNTNRLKKLVDFTCGKHYYGWYYCLPYKQALHT